MFWRSSLAALVVFGFSACVNERRIDDVDEGSGASCDDINWRMPNRGEVACPGAPDCSCGGAESCCVLLDQDLQPENVRCDALTECRGLAFVCDGPEDCGADEVCCAVETTGGGSSCSTPTDCRGLDEWIMCHGDEDCEGRKHCTPATHASVFGWTAAVCSS